MAAGTKMVENSDINVSLTKRFKKSAFSAMGFDL